MGSLSRRSPRSRRTLSRRDSPHRRPRSISRLVANALLAAAISLALTFSPWVPSLLPAPLDELGTEPAGARQSQTPTLTVTDKRASCPVDPAITPSTADDHLLVLCITPRICPVDEPERLEEWLAAPGNLATDEAGLAEVPRVNTLCVEPAECNHAAGHPARGNLAELLLKRLGYVGVEPAEAAGEEGQLIHSSSLGDESLYVFCVAPPLDPPTYTQRCSGDDPNTSPVMPVDTVVYAFGEGAARVTLSLHVVCLPADTCTRLPDDAQGANPANHRSMLIYCLAVNPCALDRGGDSEAEEVLNRRMPGDPPKSIICGTPSPCPPEPWEIGQDPSLCELTLDACPPSPLKLAPAPDEPSVSNERDESVSEGEASAPETIRYMTYSTEYIDVCEDTVYEHDPSGEFGEDAAQIYELCIDDDDDAELKGFAFEQADGADGGECRVLVPARCAPGLHRTSLSKCAQYERRTWTCLQEDGYVQRNEFNTCYLERDESASSAPDLGPCGDNAPRFAVSDCEDYVGEDYVRSPSSHVIQCADYDTGSIDLYLTIHSNSHWCEYNSRWLDADCHDASAPCDEAPVACIKRESSTGGCDAIAHTIRCRVLQAAFRDPGVSATADNIYAQGCSPCLVLPFEPASSACSTTISDEPVTYATALESGLDSVTRDRIESIFRVKDDFAHGDARCADLRTAGTHLDSECRRAPVCVDPPRGRIEANLSHAAGIAMVHSTVVVRLSDVPLMTKRHYWFDFQITINRIGGETRLLERFNLVYEDLFAYTDSLGVDTVLTMQPKVPPGDKYDSLEDILRNTGGACTLKIRPAFRLLAEPLWPDEDQPEIERLFGPDVLAWWDSMSDEQRITHSRAHGFAFLGSLDDGERQLESERRDSELREEIDCNYGDEVWCRWTPNQAGYYRLVVEGAWPVTKHGGAPHWRDNPLEPDACAPLPTPPFGDPDRYGRYRLPAGTPTELCELPALEYRLRDRLTAPPKNTHPHDGDCRHEDVDSTVSRWRAGLDDWDCLDYWLEQMGLLDPTSIGINAPFMALTFDTWDWANASIITPPPDNLELYRYSAADTVKCPSQDVRVQCFPGSSSANYTETEPLGIIVYQSRVVTRQDARSAP